MQRAPSLTVAEHPPSPLSAEAQSAVEALLREGESRNTRASYRSALRYWAAWFSLRYGQPIQLPLSVACVLQFIVDHAERMAPGPSLVCELPAHVDELLIRGGFKRKPGALSHATLLHRIAVLSKAHQLRHMGNPCHDPQVRELLSSTRKAYAKRGVRALKKDALTKDVLQAVLAVCDDSLRGRRDRALLLFAWASGGRRRSEVALAQMEDLRRIGPTEFIYLLHHSKTNQSGRELPENQKPVLGAAGAALQAWLEASGITSGAIFRRVRKGGQLAEPLSAASVRAIVKDRCAQAGVEGDFSAHSLRSGFVTEAARKNVSLADTMALTGHRSVTSVLGYFRAEAAAANPAARLLDEDGSAD